MRVSKRRRGQSLVEFSVLYSAVLLPLTFGVMYTAEMYWVWHSVNELTRDGVRYASTHCAYSQGANVVTYMQAHVPTNIDLLQFQPGGSASINVQYFVRNPDSNDLSPSQCTVDSPCVPDTVTVSVSNYEFRRFVSYLHLPPIVMPSFTTSMPMQSGGLDPDNPGVCND